MCCTVKAVVSDGFVKPPLTACPHCTGTACAIYDHRPRVCAGYQCGWRFLPWIPQDLRPDRARVMFDPLREAPPGYDQAVTVLAFDGLDVLSSPPVRSIISRLIDRGVAVYVSKPSGQGELFDLVLTNDALRPAVAASDEAALSQALERIGRLLGAATPRRVAFTPAPGLTTPQARAQRRRARSARSGSRG